MKTSKSNHAIVYQSPVWVYKIEKDLPQATTVSLQNSPSAENPTPFYKRKQPYSDLRSSQARLAW